MPLEWLRLNQKSDRTMSERLSFKQFRNQVSESVRQIDEETVDSFKVGSENYPAEIKKEGSKYVAYVDGDELDEFKSEEEARQGIEDFVKLMDL